MTDLLSPGDVYEDAFYHPCLALGVSYEDDEIWGISLIDGSYPRCAGLHHGSARKISLGEAWEMKQKHTRHKGRDGWWEADQSMKYASGQTMKVGDAVVADGMSGVIVCDFDNREFLDGYQGWDMPKLEKLGESKLDSGIMVRTVEAGLVHYPSGTENSIRYAGER